MRDQAVLETLADLISINSVNPNYDGGVPESDVVQYVEDFFRRRGIERWRQHVLPDRDNVIARIPGRDAGRRIVFEAHMDTVSVAGMTIGAFMFALVIALFVGIFCAIIQPRRGVRPD